ncbi:hypothetical protein W97_02610 [Coniosporium apollinis CBS 100218]|uniref:Uncharacterized protein n=1 Tax=Coniosporium apollinis (strain CBS 100218) TaxID=1168221 RepID=R7YND7_CONA1|nr:uncharacterized protein W97_02610 [Coniosporium apollinis CBS 100218]EON63383.1 hypothetical protein W97_02610 [Coniosporium apollinis CBS 100218]
MSTAENWPGRNKSVPPAAAPWSNVARNSRSESEGEMFEKKIEKANHLSDGPPKPAKVPRKVKANKELEAGKSKWSEFQIEGKLGKMAKKDSMFRAPEGVNARVGFTSSG